MPPYYDRQKVALGTYFHIRIAKMSKNKKLEKLLTTNLEHEYLRYRLESADPSRMRPAVEEHYQLLEKIRKKDKRGSVKLIRLHVQRSRDHIIRLLEQEKKSNEACLGGPERFLWMGPKGQPE